MDMSKIQVGRVWVSNKFENRFLRINEVREDSVGLDVWDKDRPLRDQWKSQTSMYLTSFVEYCRYVPEAPENAPHEYEQAATLRKAAESMVQVALVVFGMDDQTARDTTSLFMRTVRHEVASEIRMLASDKRDAKAYADLADARIKPEEIQELLDLPNTDGTPAVNQEKDA